MLHMCVCTHSSFVENHPIRILDDGLLISEVVLSHEATVGKGKICYEEGAGMYYLLHGQNMQVLL
jgi:hypothetical protein